MRGKGGEEREEGRRGGIGERGGEEREERRRGGGGGREEGRGREEFTHFKLLYSNLILFMAGIQLSLLLHQLYLLCLPPLTTITILLVHNTL